MLRLANDHETAAFLLVERTMQRTKPRVGTLGLKALEVAEGTIERSSLGRLRFRFDGQAADFEVENGVETRPASDREISLWNGLQRMISSTKPVADPDWNLVSMRIGPRVLRRLPLGGVVTFVPDGTPPFQGSFAPLVPTIQPELSLRPADSVLLAAIDAFLREPDEVPSPLAMAPWKPQTNSGRQAVHIFSMGLGHGRGRRHGKWHRCPICHTPVVKGLFNPPIPYGPLRPGTGAIRDLRGGYLARLRETYLLGEPSSLLPPGESVQGPVEPGPPRSTAPKVFR